MRHLCLLAVMCMFFLQACNVRETGEGRLDKKVFYLDCGELEKATEGYVPVPEGYLNAASISDIAAVRADELLVSLESHLSRNELDIAIKLMLDYTDIDSMVVTVPPGETASTRFRLPVTVMDEHHIAVVIEPLKPDDLPEWESEIDFGQRDMVFESETYEKISRVEFPPDSFGSLDRWEGKSYIFVDSEEPESITARIYMGWDDGHFFLAALVNDDKHFNNMSGSSLWNGDCLQFAIVPPGDVPAFNLGLALASGSAQMHQWAGPDTDLIGKSEYTVVRDDEEGKTFYELKIPMECLVMEPDKGAIFAFSVVVFDDDDGEGYDYWIQLTGGIAGGWAPREFQKFVLWE